MSVPTILKQSYPAKIQSIKCLIQASLSKNQSQNYHLWNNDFRHLESIEQQDKDYEKFQRVLDITGRTEIFDKMFQRKSALNLSARREARRHLRNNLVKMPLEERKKIWLLLTDSMSNQNAHRKYYKQL